MAEKFLTPGGDYVADFSNEERKLTFLTVNGKDLLFDTYGPEGKDRPLPRENFLIGRHEFRVRLSRGDVAYVRPVLGLAHSYVKETSNVQ